MTWRSWSTCAMETLRAAGVSEVASKRHSSGPSQRGPPRGSTQEQFLDPYRGGEQAVLRDSAVGPISAGTGKQIFYLKSNL